MNKHLYLLRSVSGAGKSTLAEQLELLPDSVAFAADDHHTDSEGNYNFKVENLFCAHQWCKDSVLHSMIEGKSNIIVHNTNTSNRELKPYIEYAEAYGYKVFSLIVENRHGNTDVHSVPSDIKKGQERRLRGSLKLI